MTKAAQGKRWKVVRNNTETWSVGYPSKAAAAAAAKRLNTTSQHPPHWPEGKFRAAPMTTPDYETLASLEADERKIYEKGWTP
jgi:hypothetical protein